MQSNILAICDSEQEYAYHLMDALSRRADLPFALQVFTDTDRLRESLVKSPVRLLLIAESDFAEDMRQLFTGKIVLLQEEEGIVRTAYPAVSKYKSVSGILRRVMEVAAADGQLPMPSGSAHPIQIFGIYTPVGRCLQTTFAFVTGQLLARTHKVLYLNFESYSGLGRMLGRHFETELSDLLYYLQGPEEELLIRLGQMVEEVNGMDMLPPAFSGMDISQMQGAEWLHLLDILAKSRYEYVILDLSDAVQGLYEILRRCTRVYTIIKEDGFAQAKIEQYELLLQRSAYEDVLQKTRKCRFPLFKKLPRDLNHMTTGELAQFTERMLQEDGTESI